MQFSKLLAAALLVAGGPAAAQGLPTGEPPACFEDVGCPDKDRIGKDAALRLSCENLWLVRNTLYHQRGYCFQTERGRAAFDNRGCFATATADLRLSPVEQANLRVLQAAEKRKNCR